MRLLRHLLFVVVSGISTMSPASELSSSANWQMNRLFHPTTADLASEKKGRIVIYDGLRDTTVDRALDEHFDRIDALMFIRTVVTDHSGNPLRDPETGEIVTEEDGCD